MKKLKTLGVPYKFLYFNKNNMGQIKHLISLYVYFDYASDEEYEKNYETQLNWLNQQLPLVNIYEEVYVKGQKK